MPGPGSPEGTGQGPEALGRDSGREGSPWASGRQLYVDLRHPRHTRGRGQPPLCWCLAGAQGCSSLQGRPPTQEWTGSEAVDADTAKTFSGDFGLKEPGKRMTPFQRVKRRKSN